MRRKLKVKERIQDYADIDQCHHHWIIEAANGPKSKGMCKYCGEVRYFLNTMPNLDIPKRKSNPLDLPEVAKVKLNKESKSQN